jgi:hypothetical protein
MVKAKTIGGVVAGIGVGAGQTYALRRWGDPKYRITKLGKFGQISVLTGFVAGIPAAVLGICGMVLGKGPLKRSELLAPLCASYGVTAISGAAMGLVFPVENVAAAGTARVIAGQQPARATVRVAAPAAVQAVAPVTVAPAVPTAPAVAFM